MIKEAGEAFWLCSHYNPQGAKMHEESQLKGEMLRVNKFLLESMNEKQGFDMKTRYFVRNFKNVRNILINKLHKAVKNRRNTLNL